MRNQWPELALCLLAAAVLAGCASEPSAPRPQTEAAADSPGEPGAAAEQAESTRTRPEPSAGLSGPGRAAPQAGAGGSDGLGSSRRELVAAVAEQGFVREEAFESQDLGDGREVLIASVPEAASEQVLWVAMFGAPENVHTVRVDFFPVNAAPDDSQAVENTIDGIVTTLFPDWPEASQWAEVAGNRAWQETAKVIESNPGKRQLPVLETRRDDVWLAALGVPPGVISYVITSRDACRPQASESFYQGYTACR